MSTSVRSERVNLLVSPDEKEALEEKARRAGLSLSELLRRGATTYEPDRDTDDWRSLLRSVGEMADRLVPEIDAALARMTEREREAGTEADVRAAVLRELGATAA